MFYAIITMALICLGALTFLPRLQPAFQRYSFGINFFLTLIATLVGVLLAITFSNYESEQKEKQDVIKLIHSTKTSVDTSEFYSQKLFEYFEGEEGQQIDDFFIKNPLPYPDYLDTFLGQPVVSKNLSSESLIRLNELVINLKRARQANSPMYAQFLTLTDELLSLELQFQRGEIDEVTLEQKYDELDASLIKAPASQILKV